MQAPLKLIIQKSVNHTLAFNTALSTERIADDFDMKVAFAGTIVTGMPFVLAALVHNMQSYGLQGLCQLRVDGLFNGHDRSFKALPATYVKDL